MASPAEGGRAGATRPRSGTGDGRLESPLPAAPSPVPPAARPSGRVSPSSAAMAIRRRPQPLQVATAGDDDGGSEPFSGSEPFGGSEAFVAPSRQPRPPGWTAGPATARSARDLRPRRLGLDRWAGDADSWQERGDGVGSTRMTRAVSVRGTESREELGTLHELAKLRAAKRLRRSKSLALAVWDGVGSLVPDEQLTRLDSQESESSLSPSVAEGGGEGVSVLSSVPALSLALIVCGCGCQLPFELLTSADRGCGALVSTCEAVVGLTLTAPAALRQNAWTVPTPGNIHESFNSPPVVSLGSMRDTFVPAGAGGDAPLARAQRSVVPTAFKPGAGEVHSFATVPPQLPFGFLTFTTTHFVTKM